jgi:glycosyltransferase involved in cell wall biosynthesis
MPEVQRVGIVVPMATKRGGAEQVLRDFLAGTAVDDRSGYRLFFLEEGPMATEAAEMGYDVLVVNAGRMRHFLQFLATMKRLVAWIRRGNVRVVVSWMAKAHIYAAIPARLCGAKAVWFQHGVYSGNPIDRAASALPSDLVLCCSRHVATAQFAAHPRIPTAVVYPAVDQELVPGLCRERTATLARLGFHPQRRLVGLVARLEKWKGVHTFLESALALALERDDVDFVIVGGEHPHDRAYATALQETINNSTVGSRVKLVGHQTNVADWMCACDIVVHASIEPEPFGIVILEALALGRPLIASRSGGPLEILTQGVDAILVEPGNVAALAGAIRELLDNDDVRLRLSKAGPTTAMQFTPARLAKTIDEAIESLLTTS